MPITGLTDNHWLLAEKVVCLLEPTKDITKPAYLDIGNASYKNCCKGISHHSIPEKMLKMVCINGSWDANWHSEALCLFWKPIASEESKALIRKDICIPMFITILFTIAKVWKQSKCPSKDE